MVDANILDPFIVATINTLQVQCGTKVKAGEPYRKRKSEKQEADLAAVLKVYGKGLSGALCLKFPQKTFLSLMGSMLGETFQEIRQELEDGAAELLNMVFGQAKKALNEQGYMLGKSIPTTVVGSSLRVRSLTPSPSFTIPFESPVGNFYLEVGVRNTL